MDHIERTTLEIVGHIGIITLNAPPSNTLFAPEFLPLRSFIQFTENESLKGIIITGAGKNFSTGGDIDQIFRVSSENGQLEQMMMDGKGLLLAIQSLEIPVIAAINRVCFGGGVEIALSCHIRVASENAMLAFPEVNHNIMPGLNGTVLLPQLIGKANSMSLILGGDILNATQAREIGLIDYIAPKDDALGYALKLMDKMTSDRPVSVIKSIVKALHNSYSMTPEQAMPEEIKLFCRLAREEAERRKTEDTKTC